MHIMEGFLPPLWAAIWFAVAIPFWVVGLRRINRLIAEKAETRLLGLAGAIAFVLSAEEVAARRRRDRRREVRGRREDLGGARGLHPRHLPEHARSARGG
jgi:hypothetical protein